MQVYIYFHDKMLNNFGMWKNLGHQVLTDC